MAFQRKIWTDRLVETPNRRKLVDVDTEEEKIVDVTREEGNVFSVGDKFDEANMNNLELRIKDGFDSLAEVARTGSYTDLINQPEGLPAIGGVADEIAGIGDADAIRALIKESGGESYRPIDYVEGDLKFYEDPFNVRYIGINGEIPVDSPMIAKYSDKGGNITTSIIFKDSGMELFNVKIQPVETTFYTDNMDKSGFITKFEDGSEISAQAIFSQGVLSGFRFNNGKMWKIYNASGDMPDI